MVSGEGLGYDIGSMLFFVVLALGVTIGIGYAVMKGKKKIKQNPE